MLNTTLTGLPAHLNKTRLWSDLCQKTNNQQTPLR